MNALEIRLHRVCAELARSSEQLDFIPGEVCQPTKSGRISDRPSEQAICRMVLSSQSGRCSCVAQHPEQALEHVADALNLRADKSTKFRS